MTSAIRNFLPKRTKFKRRSPLSDLLVSNKGDLRRLGSPYGGWVIENTPQLRGKSFISAGAGEDISFDLELAQLYDMIGYVIDPTPRAIRHTREVISRLGSERTEPYTLQGNQPVSAYNLTGLEASQIVIVEAALWVDDSGVQFLPPTDSSFVSHSIHPKISRDGNVAGQQISVESISPSSLIQLLNPDDVALIKLDIEGAEVDVVPDLLLHFPKCSQFLIEFDIEKVERTDSLDLELKTLQNLREAGFSATHRAGLNVLFTRG